MRLEVRLMDARGTELVNERVPKVRRRDRQEQFFLRTERVDTPVGLPLSFEIEIGPKGQGLKVRSVDAVLLWAFGFDLYQLIQFRLPTDEVVEIQLWKK